MIVINPVNSTKIPEPYLVQHFFSTNFTTHQKFFSSLHFAIEKLKETKIRQVKTKTNTISGSFTFLSLSLPRYTKNNSIVLISEVRRIKKLICDKNKENRKRNKNMNSWKLLLLELFIIGLMTSGKKIDWISLIYHIFFVQMMTQSQRFFNLNVPYPYSVCGRFVTDEHVIYRERSKKKITTEDNKPKRMFE